MAFRKTLSHRFFNMAKISPFQTRIPPSSRASNDHSSFLQKLLLSNSGEEEQSLLRRFLQKRAIYQSAISPEHLSLPIGDKLVERLRGLSRDRIRLDGIAPPKEEVDRISVEDARKVLRASQMEMVRSRLRGISKSCVSYSEFVQICCEVSGVEHGLGLATALDDSGSVIVLGNVVLLRPELVAKAVESVIPLPLAHQNDPRRKELREMEKKKVEIDKKAEAQVRKELWCGLGFFLAQTMGFMRLTFWELSWDVMEPVCFYVTSIYFMAGYAFFLRTSRDPSFEGFFESRFVAKQKRLMRAHSFDLNRFQELRRACPLPSLPPSPSEEEDLPFSSCCDCHRRSTLLGAVQ